VERNSKKARSHPQLSLDDCIPGALAFVFLISAFVFFDRFERKFRLPASGTETLASLASSPPPTEKLAVVDIEGKRYFVWIGTFNDPFDSGPPVYVFDGSGKLVNHSDDIGECDDPRLRSATTQTNPIPGISFKDALAQVIP
jgi:hypothetical protein